jgi:hypothetical protein
MARLVANLAGPGALVDDADSPSPAVDDLAEFVFALFVETALG